MGQHRARVRGHGFSAADDLAHFVPDCRRTQCQRFPVASSGSPAFFGGFPARRRLHFDLPGRLPLRTRPASRLGPAHLFSRCPGYPGAFRLPALLLPGHPALNLLRQGGSSAAGARGRRFRAAGRAAFQIPDGTLPAGAAVVGLAHVYRMASQRVAENCGDPNRFPVPPRAEFVRGSRGLLALYRRRQFPQSVSAPAHSTRPRGDLRTPRRRPEPRPPNGAGCGFPGQLLRPDLELR